MQSCMDTQYAPLEGEDGNTVSLVFIEGLDTSYMSVGITLRHWVCHELVVLPCSVYIAKLSLNYEIFLNQIDDVLFSLTKAQLNEYCKVEH